MPLEAMMRQTTEALTILEAKYTRTLLSDRRTVSTVSYWMEDELMDGPTKITWHLNNNSLHFYA